MRSCLRLALLVFFLCPLKMMAQSDSTVARIYRTHNLQNYHSLVMENELRPLPAKTDSTYSITITVTNIRNTDGVIRFKFFDDATPFPDPKGFLRVVVPKSEVKNGTFTATYYGFGKGYMGIALLDDENNNWELDTGWFLPKEGHAFSDYYHSAMRKPVYEDFRFFLSGHRQIRMKMRYY